MGVLLSFSFDGDTQLDRKLERFSLHARDASPAFEAMAESFLRMEERQFSSEGGYGSGGWAPLSPAYAARKAKEFPGKPILRRTDELYQSLTSGPQIRVIEAQFAILGTNVPWAQYHQHGKPNGTPKMPRRRPIEFTEGYRRQWVKIMQRWIVSEIAADAAGAAVLEGFSGGGMYGV